MAEARRRPSLVRIILSDYIAFLAVLFPLVFWGIFIATAFFGGAPALRGRGGRDPIPPEAAPFFLYASLIVTLLGVAILIWRIRSFQSVFTRGVSVPGRILRVSLARDRGRVEYQYSYQDQTYRAAHAVHKAGRARALRPNDAVTVVVDPENPRRAFIHDLYA